MLQEHFENVRFFCVLLKEILPYAVSYFLFEEKYFHIMPFYFLKYHMWITTIGNIYPSVQITLFSVCTNIFRPKKFVTQEMIVFSFIET